MNDNKIKLLDYVSCAAESSERSRWIMILIVVASILVFASYWNSRDGSWVRERLEISKCASRLLEANEQDKKRLIEQKGEDYVSRCSKYLVLKQFRSKDEITKSVDELEKLAAEYVLYIKIPFFGIVFDVNDLGMLGGFAFLVILMMARFSLARELDNLKQIFAEAEKRNDLRGCYDLVAMTQVLTVPPSETAVREKFWSRAPNFIFFLPPVIQLFVLINDLCTFDVGWLISPSTTLITVGCSIAFLILILMFTFLCVGLSVKIDEVWQKQARTLKI